jgi:hypothetical protein
MFPTLLLFPLIKDTPSPRHCAPTKLSTLMRRRPGIRRPVDGRRAHRCPVVGKGRVRSLLVVVSQPSTDDLAGLRPVLESVQVDALVLEGAPETLNQEESRPGESHPQALAEPYVNVSAHTAPIIQPPVERPATANGRTTGDRDEQRRRASTRRDADDVVTF